MGRWIDVIEIDGASNRGIEEIRNLRENVKYAPSGGKSKVYIIDDPAPNAFATGRNPQHSSVAMTEGLLRLMNDRELEGVIAHELAHVKHRDILISTVSATLTMIDVVIGR